MRTRRAGTVLLAAGLALLLVAGPGRADMGVETTKHNLSTSGPGPIKAASETQVCVFCHTPHNANPAAPLWSHALSGVTGYRPYRSDSMVSAPRQPDGASRLCLGCHDGTIALGAIQGRKEIPMSAGVRSLPKTSRSLLGTDLSGSHPVSIVFDERVAEENNAKGHVPLVPPMQIHDPDVKLDASSKVQCTSCHDPHSDANRSKSGIPFWNKPTFMGVCVVCHDM